MLHQAIAVNHLELVMMLVAKGAIVNANMIFTEKYKSYWVMSCLQLAMEMGNTAMIEYLRLAGAEEVIKEIPRIKGGYSGLRGLRCKNYQDGGHPKGNGEESAVKEKARERVARPSKRQQGTRKSRVARKRARRKNRY